MTPAGGVSRAFRRIVGRYRSIHAPLLAKGLSFSILFASVPLLFFILALGAFALTPDTIAALEGQLFQFLPLAIQSSLSAGIRDLAARPGSLSFVSIVLFALVVNNLFFDLNRVIFAVLRVRFAPARARLDALALNAVTILLIYAASVVNIGVRIVSARVGVVNALWLVLGRFASVVVIAAVLSVILIGGSRRRLCTGRTIVVSFAAAVVWQIVGAVGTGAVQIAAQRFVAYGVLATAVAFLAYTRLLAEIFIYAALVAREWCARRSIVVVEPTTGLIRPPTDAER